ncbi:MAG TPA: hypothetical protein VMV46_16755 [Thermoanaerobaculia bacterium]|nr:hypothetical protein [Thermoanaerobaculia bacterium]
MSRYRPIATVLFMIAALALLGASAGVADAHEKGVAEFKALECNKCHALARFAVEPTIKSEKMHGPDLGEIGSTHDAEWMQKWLLKEVELEGKTHKSKWEGTPKQLESISAWLASLEKP